MLAAVSVVAVTVIVAISWERREHFGNSHSGIPSLLGGDGHSPTSPARLIAAPVGEFLGGLHSQAISRKGRRIPRQLPGRAGAVALRLCRRSARWCTRWTLTTRTRSTGAGRTPPQACVRTISRALADQRGFLGDAGPPPRRDGEVGRADPRLLLDELSVARPGKGRPRTRPDAVRADKAYSPRGTRALLRRRGIRAVIPEPRDQQAHRRRRGSRGGRPVSYDRDDYRNRNVVERCFNRLEGWRGLATRYDKHALNYRGGVALAAIMLWLR
jgi:transposase